MRLHAETPAACRLPRHHRHALAMAEPGREFASPSAIRERVFAFRTVGAPAKGLREMPPVPPACAMPGDYPHGPMRTFTNAFMVMRDGRWCSRIIATG